jgi:uracil-DNA glycosylase family 4
MRPPSAPRSLHSKPAGCSGCALETRGTGYVPACGPPTAPILLVGEAPAYDELVQGEPFVGAAGSMLTRITRKNGWDRAAFRIDNSVRCAPPKMWLHGAPWQHAAVSYCRQYTDPVLAESHQVLVPMGAAAIKRVLGVSGKHCGPEAFHGTVTVLPSGQRVVPTFHPSYLQRGATNLIGVVSFDLQRAHEAVAGWDPEPITLVEDPPIDWFTAWAAQTVAAGQQDPDGTWLVVDIETPDKAGGRDEGELGSEDQSYRIERVNVCCHPDEGVTVPYVEPYISALDGLLTAFPGIVVGWNLDYDLPRLAAAGHRLGGRPLDFMWAWHILQSDLPRGLGFVAPFYSTFGPWKHLTGSKPVTYACLDGPQTLRSAFGIARDLQAAGQWDVFLRHVDDLDRRVLKPASVVGVRVDRPQLLQFKADLSTKARRLLHQLQGHIPESCRPLQPAGGLKKAPLAGEVISKGRATKKDGTAKKDPGDELKQQLYAQTATIVEKLVIRDIQVCMACGAQEISRTHRCQDKSLTPDVQIQVATVTRWFWQEPFNPDSPDQILAVIKAKGHQPGKSKTTDESTDRKTLETNLAKTKDPFYKDLLAYRAIQKVRSTYVIGTEKRLDADDRLHPQHTFKPSTQRLSYVAPNIQNVVARDSGEESLAAGFRRCVVSATECRLLEVDYSGIEAVLVGWFARSPAYIRLAKQGVHAGLASHVIGEPYDPTWDDQTLAAYLLDIKKRTKTDRNDSLYDICKRVVHGSGYCLTPFGMQRNFPEQFPTVAKAEKLQKIYFSMAPDIPAWQTLVQRFAHDHGYLGGPGDPPFGHPYGYRHWFWSVVGYQRLTMAQYLRRQSKGQPVTMVNNVPYSVVHAEDAKRAVAFLPQSTAAAILKEAMLELFANPEGANYVGDAYFGRTPLRAPIHDSLLLEVPLRVWDRTLERVLRVMQAPLPALPCPPAWGLGLSLSIGVEAKAGSNWAAMAVIDERVTAVERDVVPEDEDAEDVADLGTVA